MKKLLFFFSLALMLVVSTNVNAQLAIGGGEIPSKNANLQFTNHSNERVGVLFALTNAQNRTLIWKKNIILNPKQVYNETVKVHTGDYILGVTVGNEYSEILSQKLKEFHVHYATYLPMSFRNNELTFEPGIAQ